MARKPSRMVLYEVASKASGKKAAKTTWKKRKAPKPDRTAEVASVKPFTGTGRKKSGLQFSVLLVVALGVILAVLLVMQAGKFIGQMTAKEDQQSQSGTGDTDTSADNTDETTLTENGGQTDDDVEAAQGSERNHEIVIATYEDSKQLEPVREHFRNNQIAAEIKKSGRYHILVTVDKYFSPRLEQGKAELASAKEKIKTVGDSYKPPKGYKGFSFDNVWEKRVR